jgi:hypothetical protein
MNTIIIVRATGIDTLAILPGLPHSLVWFLGLFCSSFLACVSLTLFTPLHHHHYIYIAVSILPVCNDYTHLKHL